MTTDVTTTQMIAQAVRDTAPFRKNISARDDLLTRIGSDDPDRQQALEERLSALEAAHQSMQQAQKDMGAARKEAARQKIAQIKAKIQALQMMIGDDADSRARKVAQLARELAQAVRAYKAAGGQGAMTTGAATSVSGGTAAEGDAEAAAVQTSVLVAAVLLAATGQAENRAAQQADKAFAEEVRGVARLLKNMRRGDRDDHGTNRFLGQALRGLAGMGLASAASGTAFSLDVTV